MSEKNTNVNKVVLDEGMTKTINKMNEIRDREMETRVVNMETGINEMMEALKEQMKDGIVEKDYSLRKGNLALLGATSTEELEDLFETLHSEHTLHTNDTDIERVVNQMKEKKKTILIFRGTDLPLAFISALRLAARHYDIRIVIGEVINTHGQNRLSCTSDFKRTSTENPALIIGVTEAGVCINKNRFGGYGEMKEGTVKEAIVG